MHVPHECLPPVTLHRQMSDVVTTAGRRGSQTLKCGADPQDSTAQLEKANLSQKICMHGAVPQDSAAQCNTAWNSSAQHTAAASQSNYPRREPTCRSCPRRAKGVCSNGCGLECGTAWRRPRAQRKQRKTRRTGLLGKATGWSESREDANPLARSKGGPFGATLGPGWRASRRRATE